MGSDAHLEQVRQNIITKYLKQVVGNEAYRNCVVELKLVGNVSPILSKPYRVPPGLALRVKSELKRLVDEGVLYLVDDTGWASPMVVVMKNNGQIRLCIDPSKTINDYLVTDHYLIPKIDELLMKFSGKKVFSIIDLKGAYQQLLTKPECQM